VHQGNLFSKECHPVPALNQNISGKKFKNDSEMAKVVIRWMITGDRDWYQKELKKCLSCGGDYVEKHWYSSTMKCKLFVTI
jgi:hypothetical protein